MSEDETGPRARHAISGSIARSHTLQHDLAPRTSPLAPHTSPLAPYHLAVELDRDARQPRERAGREAELVGEERAQLRGPQRADVLLTQRLEDRAFGPRIQRRIAATAAAAAATAASAGGAQHRVRQKDLRRPAVDHDAAYGTSHDSTLHYTYYTILPTAIGYVGFQNPIWTRPYDLG